MRSKSGKRNAEVGSRSSCWALSLLMVLPPDGARSPLARASASLVVLLALNTRTARVQRFPSLFAAHAVRLALNVCTRPSRQPRRRGHSSVRRVRIGGNYIVGLALLILVASTHVITKGAGASPKSPPLYPRRNARQADGDRRRPLRRPYRRKAGRSAAKISRAADFYGAMDGSSKFVKGDAIAGLLITAINIVGGIFIGAFQRALPIGQAMSQ